ncbi:MAG: RNA polymerase sigma factor [Deltaproteobacteria bacterium]|nr:RNA polymerase sigma factor [Deltaproteobacteria bacterium]
MDGESTAANPVEASIRERLCAGDLTEAAKLGLSAYGPELLRFAAAMLRSLDAAEDAFAEACEKIWAGLPSFRRDASFRTWAFVVVRRVCFDHLRCPRARRQAPLSAAGPLSGIAAQVRTATQPFLRTDVKDRLRTLRESLSPEEQALLSLRIDRGLPWSEIAVILHDEVADAAERKRREAGLRKKLERLKERLREVAKKEGLLE